MQIYARGFSIGERSRVRKKLIRLLRRKNHTEIQTILGNLVTANTHRRPSLGAFEDAEPEWALLLEQDLA